MAQFQFKEGLTLDFGAVQFEVHPDDPDFLETYETECKRCAELEEKMKARAKEDSVSAIREACTEVAAAIDNILGAGSVEEIFSGRPIGFYDLLDVFNYITEESKAYRESRMPNISPTNREKRRAAAKKVPKPSAGEEK